MMRKLQVVLWECSNPRHLRFGRVAGPAVGTLAQIIVAGE